MTMPSFTPSKQVLTMGLQVIQQHEWLIRSKDFQRVNQEKRKLIDQQKDSVLAAQPGTDQSIAELVQLVSHTLDSTNTLFENKPHSDSEDSAITALTALSFLAEEDFCLLSPDEQGNYCLRAATLCAPTFWLLGEKLGKPIHQIHQPIPGFKEQLDHKIARFFNHIKEGQWLVRYNWTLCDVPERFQPNRIKTEESVCFLRTERQVFTKLSSGFLVFSILVQHTDVNELKKDSTWCEDFIGLLNQLSPEMIAYKGIGHLLQRAQNTLRAR